MKLVIDKQAQRRLLGMPAKTRTAMLHRLKVIAADPFAAILRSSRSVASETLFASVTATGVRSTGLIVPRKR